MANKLNRACVLPFEEGEGENIIYEVNEEKQGETGTDRPRPTFYVAKLTLLNNGWIKYEAEDYRGFVSPTFVEWAD